MISMYIFESMNDGKLKEDQEGEMPNLPRGLCQSLWQKRNGVDILTMRVAGILSGETLFESFQTSFLRKLRKCIALAYEILSKSWKILKRFLKKIAKNALF